MDRQKLSGVFREANWLTQERITLWATCFGVAWFLFLFWDAWAHSTLGITDAKGEHIGRDFINYWSGAQLAAGGHAETVYNPKQYLAFQRGFAGPQSEFKMYSYPPVAILFTLPLCLVSFGVGYVLWSLASYSLSAVMFSRFVPWRMALPLAISTPACILSLQSGQNGAFTAALLGGGLTILGRMPVTAGIMFGLLCYKPQLGLLLPLALAAGGYWRSFFAAALTVLALFFCASQAFGIHIWQLFAEHMGRQTMLMEEGYTLWHRMPTVFAGLRMWGTGIPFAYVMQGVATVLGAVAVFFTWRRASVSLPLKSAVLVLAAFLVTPYGWDYDMVVAVFALFWVAADARENGWMPWEKFAWMLLIFLPFHMTPMSKMLGLQLGAVFFAIALWMVLRRAKVISSFIKGSST